LTSTPNIIDTKMHGFPGITATFLLRGERTALIETGPKSTVDNVSAGLEAAGIDRLDWIVVTHIHLDHAGAAGTLALRWPEARIAVHEVGAPHLVDPSKLWSSATRIYGDRMESMWAGMDPLESDRIQILKDGDKVDLGGRSLQAIETPGHAYHHHALLDDETGAVFVGDALGVRLQDAGLVRPATPPPEFHLTKALDSIERIRSLGATRAYLTHFGANEDGISPLDVDLLCDQSAAALQRWGKWITEARDKTSDLDEVTDHVLRSSRADMEGSISDYEIERLEQTTSYRMNTWGYMRYFDKHATSS
jgi:glyoxylase-like metal-dependent hydrolase (beta-lactamase superfamily II)